ncbi:PadR family transcriptional regulator [Brucepastera parasyntrophica]|uniref:PadR family transcriptional regulator n=1 Tax=Brucepastera parasyntrophica TaxID=2880008 RepID=UPI00210BD369|nr:PadR family transcriptional regulator [Brucepastera parasyntrophica]ULQ58490.1 PadR family transcriptional regulator [Brucepastera parasyntrophica]
MKGKVSSDMLRGHTDTIVLSLLKQGDSYGYEIYKKILEKTGDRFEMKEATLYASFRRLETDGCITSYWGAETHGGRRKYYKITQKGTLLLNRNIDDWQFTNRVLAELFRRNDNAGRN